MPFTTFDVNIFGTSHVDLDGQNNANYSREFVIHVLQVECNQPIATFDMFIEFYAFIWQTAPNGYSWVTSINPQGGPPPTSYIDNMFLNGRPQVIHLDTMTPNSPIALYSSCTPVPVSPCPSPADMRLTSQMFQVPIAATLTGYDTSITDMYDVPSPFAKLPVNITIVADGCRYSSSLGTEINIYTDYESSGGLFGANYDTNPIGFNEKITIS